MTVTVYGREGSKEREIPECVQCKYTCSHLDRQGIAYDYHDVDRDAVANGVVHNQAIADGVNPVLPLVTVTDGHGNLIDHWFGFKHDKIRGLHK